MSDNDLTFTKAKSSELFDANLKFLWQGWQPTVAEEESNLINFFESSRVHFLFFIAY